MVKILHVLLSLWIIYCVYLYVTAVEMEILIFLFVFVIGIVLFPFLYLTLFGIKEKKKGKRFWNGFMIAAFIWIGIPLSIAGYDTIENKIREYKHEQKLNTTAPTTEMVEEFFQGSYLKRIFDSNIETTYKDRIFTIELRLTSKDFSELVKEIAFETPQNSSLSEEQYVEQLLKDQINEVWFLPPSLWVKAWHQEEIQLSVWINGQYVGQEIYRKNEYDVQDQFFEINKTGQTIELLFNKNGQQQSILLMKSVNI